MGFSLSFAYFPNMVKYLNGQERELEFKKDTLRTKCGLAYLITKDEWYAKKRDSIPEKKIKIISKEEVLKEIEEIKILEASLKTYE